MVSTLAVRYLSDYTVIKKQRWFVPLVSDATTKPLFQNANNWSFAGFLYIHGAMDQSATQAYLS
jgi:hypothetical protein